MQLKDTVAKLFELWNLMDSSKEERNGFSSITSILGSSESEITGRGALSTEMIEKVPTLFPFPFSIFLFFLFYSVVPTQLIETSLCRHQLKWRG